MATTNTPMALLLLLFPAILGLLTLAPNTTTAAFVLFSDHFYRINGGQTLTDGNYKLTVGTNCSLALYKSGALVFFAKTSIPSTRDCQIYLNDQGVLYVYPHDVRIAPTPMLGKPSSTGRYAFVLDAGKLNIYGAAIWSNRVRFNYDNTLDQNLQDSSIAQSASTANSIIYSGKYFDGNSTGDVIVAANPGVSVVLRKDCGITVVAKDGSTLWETSSGFYKVERRCRLELRSDGELVLGSRVSYANGKPKTVFRSVWRSGVSARVLNQFVGILRLSGELVVYGLKERIYGAGNMNTNEGEVIKMVAEA